MSSDAPSRTSHLGSAQPPKSITLSPAEIQSGHDRVRWAQDLIAQLPKDHNGRNSWLLNYGLGEEADLLRCEWRRTNPYPETAYFPAEGTQDGASPKPKTHVEREGGR